MIGRALELQSVDTFDEVDHVQFKVGRISRVETEDDNGMKSFYHTSHDEWLQIASIDISNYLRVLNRTLYYALAYYLIGCDNPRYFLVEFYKAVEVIQNVFHGEKECLKALQPFGTTENDFKKFKKVCNDTRQAPLDIGRHAPEPGAQLYSVDLRNLLITPRPQQIFESSTLLCRQVIDSYIAFLIKRSF